MAGEFAAWPSAHVCVSVTICGGHDNDNPNGQLTSISSPPHAVLPDLPSLGFVRVEPRVRERDDGNQIWVLPWMLSILDGQSAAIGFSDRHADAQNSLIIHGYYFRVSLAGDSSKKPDVERLRDLSEAWTICYRKPKPGWRLFGRLYARGLFIGTDMRDRHDVGTTKAYTAAAIAAVGDLERRLPGIPPCQGNEVGDYFLGLASNVDKPSLYGE
ncbi:hypothetical protein [Methylobacterium sp. Leaf100]|uniref:hypothetical protein n=1 Tax=Methylobacterium sp. Leaf100 TaxID=1736252 RepID=UPI00138F6F5A|nr:hypothetical protein [Methylobacterium sp. Leaf100]